jgi:glycosyltransferase involved in cell wall biosynthesis
MNGAEKMRIAIASWAPFHAGAEVAAERLALGLQEAGHEVLVVLGTEGETLRRMRSVGLRCEFVPLMLTDKWRMWRWRAAQRELAGIFRRFQPDIVHFNDLPTSQMAGRAARELGIPRVCHHRYTFETTAANWLNKFGAERHLYVSRALMTEMEQASAELRVAPRAVVYDGLPLPPARTNDDRREARAKLGLSSEELYVLYAGQITERKGVADLIRAWMLLSEGARAKAELLIVGEDLQNGGRYRVEMEQLARSIGCQAKFTGFQRNLPEWQMAADIAVTPSHFDPLGNVVLEAMAASLPVVGCEVGGIPEMIVHEETGLLAPPHAPAALAGALERLIKDPAERERFGAAGRVRCETHFDIAVHTREILNQYRLVLSETTACMAS